MGIFGKTQKGGIYNQKNKTKEQKEKIKKKNKRNRRITQNKKKATKGNLQKQHETTSYTK